MTAGLIPGPPEPLPPNWPLADHAHSAHVAPYRWHVPVMGQGPDMLLLHGAGASSHSWAGLAPILAETHRVLAPDLPGHGFTRARGMRAGIDDMTRDILALTGAIGSNPRVIVGHSAGGALALSMSLHMDPAPDAVIVLNGALENFQGLAGLLFPVMARLLALNPFAAPFLARSATRPGAVERVISGTGTELSDTALEPYRTLISDRRHVAGTLSMMAAWSLSGLTARLGDIGIPVLFLHGTRDEAVRPDVARRAAGKIPGSSIEVIDGLGHLMHEEDPTGIAARITQFIRDLPQA